MADVDPQDRRARAALRGLAGDGPELEAPPAGLWDRIAAEAFSSVDASSASLGPGDRQRTEGADQDRPVAPAVSLSPAPAPQHRGRGTFVLRVAAVVVAFCVGLGVAWLTFGRGDGDTGADVVASAELEPVDSSAGGSAQVVDLDGVPTLELELEELPPTAGFFEVWVASADLEQMVSLGPVHEGGRYQLPEGFDAGDTPVVDVSDEPPDGDAGHSAVSVLRGTLTA